jgi:protein subunit release factor B
MSIFPVSMSKEKALRDRMASLDIKEEDIDESFVRSRGRGGQKLNKTSSCVYLKHLPTGIEVKCMMERSQSLNRYRARVILADKVEALIKGEESQEAQRIAKIRRQKRRRSRRAKEKVLEEKRHVAVKKKLRSMPSIEDNDM